MPSGGLGLVISVLVWRIWSCLRCWFKHLSTSALALSSVIESFSGFCFFNLPVSARSPRVRLDTQWDCNGNILAGCMSLDSKPSRSLDYTANTQLATSITVFTVLCQSIQTMRSTNLHFTYWNRIFNTMIFHTWTKPQLTDYHYCLRLSASIPSQYWRSTSAVPAVNFIRTSRRNSVAEYWLLSRVYVHAAWFTSAF